MDTIIAEINKVKISKNIFELFINKYYIKPINHDLLKDKYKITRDGKIWTNKYMSQHIVNGNFIK
jgi:hypothetical protein